MTAEVGVANDLFVAAVEAIYDLPRSLLAGRALSRRSLMPLATLGPT